MLKKALNLITPNRLMLTMLVLFLLSFVGCAGCPGCHPNRAESPDDTEPQEGWEWEGMPPEPYEPTPTMQA